MPELHRHGFRLEVLRRIDARQHRASPRFRDYFRSIRPRQSVAILQTILPLLFFSFSFPSQLYPRQLGSPSFSTTNDKEWRGGFSRPVCSFREKNARQRIAINQETPPTAVNRVPPFRSQFPLFLPLDLFLVGLDFPRVYRL